MHLGPFQTGSRRSGVIYSQNRKDCKKLKKEMNCLPFSRIGGITGFEIVFSGQKSDLCAEGNRVDSISLIQEGRLFKNNK